MAKYTIPRLGESGNSGWNKAKRERSGPTKKEKINTSGHPETIP